MVKARKTGGAKWSQSRLTLGEVWSCPDREPLPWTANACWVPLSPAMRGQGCPCADEHLTVIHIWLVLIRNDFKLCMLNLDFRCIPEVGWWALCYKGGIFVSLVIFFLPLFNSILLMQAGEGFKISGSENCLLLASCPCGTIWDCPELQEVTTHGPDKQCSFWAHRKVLQGGTQLITKMSWDVNFTIV